ncbi:hypothetical protein HPP92_005047 [Vanilla planifolia]|uniref:TauD/TfdA-like domain-containing protein n=1 Tax=Vanilla planifolia TaxID=51239 RepID=A0A835RNY5_VANPL|nr:hypothetical protein HPP92_005047 [Vanilla planifolia]
MAFVEGNMPTEKVFDGIVFPKTLFPAAGNRERLVEILEAEKEHLGEYLRQHGAVLLRGFHVRSADDFSRVVQAFGWKEFVYEGAANRTKLADRVLTVNTEPLHHFLNFHHEMSLLREYPNKVIFCCIEAPPEGGETSIIPSDFVVKRMEEKVPKELEKLDKEGINVVMNAKCWQRMLDTEDEIEAEKRAMQKFICSSITFNDDGTVNFNYGPMSAVRELNGKRVMWHMVTEHNLSERKTKITYADGSRMEEKVPKELEKLDKEGINVVMNAKCWQRMLDTEDEIEAEKRAMQKFICSSITFNDDGTVNFNYGPMSAVRELNGKRVMWHMVTGTIYRRGKRR